MRVAEGELAGDLVAGLVESGHKLLVAYLAIVLYSDHLAGNIDINSIDAVDLAQLTTDSCDAVVAADVGYLERFLCHERVLHLYVLRFYLTQ